MSTISFLNIAMQGRINPTLPLVAELVGRGHTVTYHSSPTYAATLEAAGATVLPDPAGDQPPPDPPIPLTLLAALAEGALEGLPTVLDDLRRIKPDLIVHDASSLIGAVAARELGVPAVALWTTLAFNAAVPSPSRAGADLLRAALRRPRTAGRLAGARWSLSRRHDTRGLPLVDIAAIREPLNLVFTSREFQPDVDSLDGSFRFVGPSIGARIQTEPFPFHALRDPVVYVSLGTIFSGDAQLTRTLVRALSPLAGTVVLSTGRADPAHLGELPSNVLAHTHVPQPEVLQHAALFVTHAGMNSVNESLYAGTPMLLLPQGADQPDVAQRVVDLGAGLAVPAGSAVASATMSALARRLLGEPGFTASAQRMQALQHAAGGYVRAADELEAHVSTSRASMR
ncbi:MAG: oleandomycin glycosyltransferase [Actinomycetota bacterium]|nr:oleandomycin glycosyltransferase [Actinomycetota bacterium]